VVEGGIDWHCMFNSHPRTDRSAADRHRRTEVARLGFAVNDALAAEPGAVGPQRRAVVNAKGAALTCFVG